MVGHFYIKINCELVHLDSRCFAQKISPLMNTDDTGYRFEMVLLNFLDPCKSVSSVLSAVRFWGFYCDQPPTARDTANLFTLRNIPSARGRTLFPVRCADRHAGVLRSSVSFLCATRRRILPAVERRKRWLRCRFLVHRRRQRLKAMWPVLR